MFRSPTDDPEISRNFYNDGSYRQGFTTEMPDAAGLEQLKATAFHGSPKDYRTYIALLEALGLAPGNSLFDFGCSWGYGSYQLNAHGFRVTAHEIAAERRAYAADHLGIEFLDDLDALEARHPLFESFDAFFSAHVLEHVPCPRQVFAWSEKLLRSGGIFVAFIPNGSEAHQRRNRRWNQLWGEVHPNLIDHRFLRRSFAGRPHLLTSAPYLFETIKRPTSGEIILGPLDGYELMIAAVKTNRPSARGDGA